MKHIIKTLDAAADILEAYSEHEEFSHEIRELIKKIEKEMTYEEELFLESKGEK
jgi:hypothetical protein